MKPEIERKFLIDLSKIPCRLDDCPSEIIEQGYLLWNDQGEEARIRKIGHESWLTVKKGEGINRLEQETEITREQYETLLPVTNGKRLRKTRYHLTEKGTPVVLDVYSGKASGLVVAEVEFNSAEEYRKYVPPSWFGKEISENESYRNRNLAVE